MMVGLWVAPRAAVTVESKAGALVVLSAGMMVAQWDVQMVDRMAARSAEYSVEVMAARTVVRLVALTAGNLVVWTVVWTVVWLVVWLVKKMVAMSGNLPNKKHQ